jgi:hypothetical protein
MFSSPFHKPHHSPKGWMTKEIFSLILREYIMKDVELKRRIIEEERKAEKGKKKV